MPPPSDAYRGRSGLGPKPYRTPSMPPFDRSFYQRHEEETRLRELQRGSRGEGEGEGGEEEEKEERGERKGKKRGSRRSVHASGNASCMPIVGRISRGT